jgi:hypothetical protein
MLPSFYQTLLRRHLSESQYLTLELLLLLIQTHRCVTLSTLASVAFRVHPSYAMSNNAYPRMMARAVNLGVLTAH